MQPVAPVGSGRLMVERAMSSAARGQRRSARLFHILHASNYIQSIWGQMLQGMLHALHAVLERGAGRALLCDKEPSMIRTLQKRLGHGAPEDVMKLSGGRIWSS